MRILSISGENIASLSAPFTLDFTQEPLASAGLFAITGETGAGKSSILDAMCLALYGDAPRLAGGSNDEIPDPSGKSLKSRDARAILRRGAVRGWAEVRFTARDGQDYSARWEARRARDRAEGALQNVSRSVARLSDGQTLAAQSTAVLDLVTSLTGFTYEEFRRTVLLAQGDFDAFLRADTNDRAALLEKVTGTDLYRKLSARIYERHEAAREAHDRLDAQRAGHHLLTPDEQAQLIDETQALRLGLSAREAEAETVKAALAQHERYENTRLWLTRSMAQLESALQAQAEGGERRALLQKLQLAAPLRAPWQAVKDAEARLEETRAAESTTQTQAETQGLQASTASDSARTARAALAAQEVIYKSFGPLWDEASRLDNHILAAAEELDRALLRRDRLAARTAQGDSSLQKLQAEQETLGRSLGEARLALAALPHEQRLSEAWPQVEERLKAHAEARADMARAGARQEAAAGVLAQSQITLDKIAEAITRDEADDGTRARDEAALNAEILALAEAHPPQRAAALQGLGAALGDMARAAAQYRVAETDLAGAQERAQNAQGALAQAQRQEAEAKHAQLIAQTQIDSLRAPSQSADLAVSEAAKALRLTLAPDLPCPVCGGLEHPALHDHALADLALRLRQDLRMAESAAQTARQAEAEAHREADRAHANAEQAQKDISRAEMRREEALSLWHEARALAQTAGSDLPQHPAQSEALDPLRAETQAQQNAETAAQERLASARGKAQELARLRDALRLRLAQNLRLKESEVAKAAAARGEETLAAQALTGAKTIAQRMETLLTPLLAPLGESLGAAGLQDRLLAKLKHLQDLEARHSDLESRVQALTPRLAAAQNEAANLTAQSREAAEIHQQRARDLQELRKARAPLLDGEATGPHRTKQNDLRKSVQAQAESAAMAEAEAAAAAASARAHAEAAKFEAARAAQVLEMSREALASASAAAGLTGESLVSLLARPPQEAERLARDLRALDDAVLAAQAQREARAADHQAAIAQGLPPEPAETLRESLAALTPALQKDRERIGAIEADLKRDAETRARLKGLEAEIEKAKAEWEVWRAVNHAAGSRNGDKFARIAQSITLDVLVDHANHHLADLNPRYRLRRAEDLALQVEDRDMGHDARATRSLSGGERFLVSLALALALSRMGSKGGLAATLFIDEGFGSLDATSLDLAIDALESLQSQGRQVGVISHVEAMKDRITTQITLKKQGGGKSLVEVTSGGMRLP